jgi:hypothetical protein
VDVDQAARVGETLMLVATSKFSWVFAVFVFLFLDGVLRGAAAMRGVTKSILIACCAGLALVILIIIWPLIEQISNRDFQLADFFSAANIFNVVIFFATVTIAQILGIYVGRRVTAFVTRGDTT